MPTRQLTDILDERDSIAHALEIVRNTIPFIILSKDIRAERRQHWQKQISHRLSELDDLAYRGNFNTSKYRSYLQSFKNRCEDGKKPTDSLPKFLIQRLKKLDSEAECIPASTDKAEEFILHNSLANNETEPEVLLYVSRYHPRRNLTAQVENFLEELRRHDMLPSPLGGEALLSFEVFRFTNRFSPGTDARFLDLATQYFRGELSQLVTDIGLMAGLEPPAEVMHSLGIDLWLCARDRQLAACVRDLAGQALNTMAEWQTPEGYWIVRRRSSDDELAPTSPTPTVVPSNRLTALLLLGFLRFADQSRYGDQCRRAASWLSRIQNSNGSWNDLDDGQGKPEIDTTLVTLEALRRAGVDRIEQIASLAERWLISQQYPAGYWYERPYNIGFLTVSILEYFRNKDRFRVLNSNRLQIARHFLEKSELLASEPSAHSRRLSVVACYHGIEMFLYGLVDEGVANFDIYEANGQRTIGFRSALSELQRDLFSRGILDAPNSLRFRTQLLDLASSRDAIIHRGAEVSEPDIGTYLDTARKFVSKYSLALLDLDLIE